MWIWNQYGLHKQIIGPKLVYLYCSTIRFLDRHIANGNQYLRIESTDGTFENRVGPCVVYENPVFHVKIEVKDAVVLPTINDCLVLLRNTTSVDGIVESIFTKNSSMGIWLQDKR